MSELDKVLDVFLDTKKLAISKTAKLEDSDDLVSALRERTKNKIVSEIKEEYKKELKKEVNTEIQEEQHRKKISELKTLMWEGFIIAFIVGLTTDQVTDIIAHFKGSALLPSVWTTIGIAVVLLLVAIGIYAYTFFNNVLSIIREYKDAKKK